MQTPEFIFPVVCQVISGISNFSQEDITNEMSLTDDLDLDSLYIVELSMKLEMEFHISLPDEVWEKNEGITVGDVVKMIDKYVNV